MGWLMSLVEYIQLSCIQLSTIEYKLQQGTGGGYNGLLEELSLSRSLNTPTSASKQAKEVLTRHHDDEEYDEEDGDEDGQAGADDRILGNLVLILQYQKYT